MSPLQRPTVDPKRYYSTIKAFLFYGVLNNTEIAVLWGKLHDRSLSWRERRKIEDQLLITVRDYAGLPS